MTRWLAALVLAAFAASACAPKAPPAAPVAPRFPEFVFPEPGNQLPPALAADLRSAWAQLQRGDPAAADKSLSRLLARAPGSAPVLAAMGYSALARQDAEKAVARFGEALEASAAWVPALLGRAQAYLVLDQPGPALASFEAAQAADPALALGPRIETLRFRVLEDTLARARRFAQAGDWEQARQAYGEALRASPDSAVLYRELAGVERRAGLAAEADAHLGRAIELDPDDRTTHVLLAETREEAGDLDGAIASYEAALRLEPSAEIERRLASARERADLARLPAEFQGLADQPQATRADLAAALGIRLPGLLARAPARPTPVLTDLRAHWARPWILASVRAGVLEGFPNHTFQPSAIVTRADLAVAVARVLDLLAAEGDRRAIEWRAATASFTDLPPAHPAQAAAARAVTSGVISGSGQMFDPARPVSGRELVEAVSRLQRLAGPLAARGPR